MLRANHHPDRFITWGGTPRLSAGNPCNRGPRRLRLEVREFNLRGPDGYYIMRINWPSNAAHLSVRDKCCYRGNSKPGTHIRINGGNVEYKAVPIHRPEIKRRRPR